MIDGARIVLPVLECPRCGDRHPGVPFAEVTSRKPGVRQFRGRCPRSRFGFQAIFVKYRELPSLAEVALAS